MSNLLQVTRMQPNAMEKKKAVPLFLEWPVNPELAPFLISSSTSLMWIEEAHPGDQVRVAVRKISSPGEIFWSIVEAIGERGERDKWGNVHPFTEEGVLAAVDHVTSYELDPVELLFPRVTDMDGWVYSD